MCVKQFPHAVGKVFGGVNHLSRVPVCDFRGVNQLSRIPVSDFHGVNHLPRVPVSVFRAVNQLPGLLTSDFGELKECYIISEYIPRRIPHFCFE